ncbi:MAG: hypothetical protein CMJ76_11070 [Planctomycetaceae bacterium]|nr:hypothetical protein [Planctomycetaceae bacterium]
MLSKKFLLTALLLLLFTSPCFGKGKYPVQRLSDELAKEYELDTNFYKKTTYIQDILIATSDKVSDFAHR